MNDLQPMAVATVQENYMLWQARVDVDAAVTLVMQARAAAQSTRPLFHLSMANCLSLSSLLVSN